MTVGISTQCHRSSQSRAALYVIQCEFTLTNAAKVLLSVCLCMSVRAGIVPAGSTVDSFGNVVACAPNTYQATAFNYATSGTPGCKACPGTSTSAAGSATCESCACVKHDRGRAVAQHFSRHASSTCCPKHAALLQCMRPTHVCMTFALHAGTVPAGSRWTGTTTEACAADSYSDQTRAINPVSQPPIPCTNCPTGSSTNSATGSTSIAACR